jgi:hypothetical protein
MKYLLVLVPLLFATIGCGPSKEVIELREKIKQDSINAVNQKIELISKIDEVKQAQQKELAKKEQALKAKEEAKNNPLNYLTFTAEIERRGFLKNDRFKVSIKNTSDRVIKNVGFVVKCYSKTDYLLGNVKEVIYEFIKPGDTYSRSLDLSRFPENTEKRKVALIQAQFSNQ